MFENKINGAYDYASFAVSNNTTNYNVATNQSALFSLIKIATKVFIWSDQTISFSFNSTGYPAIPLNVANGESPYEGKDIIVVSNIFINNTSGSTANIKILLGV